MAEENKPTGEEKAAGAVQKGTAKSSGAAKGTAKKTGGAAKAASTKKTTTLFQQLFK